MPVIAHFFEYTFAVNSLLQSAQRFLYRLTLFQFNFSQNFLTSSPFIFMTVTQLSRVSLIN